ncbi:hypothetical protein [Corynebacterium glyciniphilum]|uniref:hypothetical protein n=1 Tax=Corynebacterium glyciniphilum TaxID=1404244 RepID=UPI003DA0ADCE
MSRYDSYYDDLEALGDAQADAAVRIRRGNRDELVDPMEWDDSTQKWSELQAQLAEIAKRLASVDGPPRRGEAWDRLVSDYVEIRRLAEALTTEAIGIDLEHAGAKPTQLARDTEIAQSWVSLQKKRWLERRYPD